MRLLLLLTLALVLLAGCQPQVEAKTTVKIGGSGVAIARFAGNLQAYSQSYGSVELRTEVWNSATALQKLQDGSLDIAFVSQPLTNSPGLTPTPLIREPIAVIVHPANKVNSLTQEQLSRVFSGRAQSWGEVGGSPGAIQVVSREDGSGTRSVFLSLVLDQSRLAHTARIFPSPEGVLGYVAENQNAVGYASLATINDKVKIVKVDSLPPDAAGYKLVQPLVAITAGGPTTPTLDLINFLKNSVK